MFNLTHTTASVKKGCREVKILLLLIILSLYDTFHRHHDKMSTVVINCQNKQFWLHFTPNLTSLFPQRGDVCKDCTQIFALVVDLISEQSFQVASTRAHTQTLARREASIIMFATKVLPCSLRTIKRRNKTRRLAALHTSYFLFSLILINNNRYLTFPRCFWTSFFLKKTSQVVKTSLLQLL